MSRPRGWDQRDYKLWSALQTLPSYGLVSGDAKNPMLSRREVELLLESLARQRARTPSEKAASGQGESQ